MKRQDRTRKKDDNERQFPGINNFLAYSLQIPGQSDVKSFKIDTFYPLSMTNMGSVAGTNPGNNFVDILEETIIS